MTILKSDSDGALLPLYNMSSHPSRTPSSSPPPYSPSPSPSIDLDPSDPSSKVDSNRLAEEARCRNNKRRAMICIFLAVMLLLVIPLAVFSVIVSKAHLKEKCTANDGGVLGGDAVCER
ncbi:hypothetical protein VTL71DRAFT_7635 [Oculimacula yallundae]|uniref:Uncharacterized protein n=1 Tax=Oculimacula yallundae TaxID=86028 RepID=A0ABR4BUS6_9HELO